jgi:endonuclease/exonuclease/phosphatase family metal-dependent hydrolase
VVHQQSLVVHAARVVLLPLLALVPVGASLFPSRVDSAFDSRDPLSDGVLGFRVSQHWTDEPDETNSLRIVTCNAGGGELNVRRLRQYLRDVRPDVVALQEWDTRHQEHVFDASEWKLVESRGTWVASRRAIAPLDGLTPDQFELPGRVGVFELSTSAGPVRFVNVHLPTVRDGLDAVIHRQDRALAALEANAGARDRDGATARQLANQGADPLIVAGD